MVRFEMTSSDFGVDETTHDRQRQNIAKGRSVNRLAPGRKPVNRAYDAGSVRVVRNGGLKPALRSLKPALQRIDLQGAGRNFFGERD